MYIGELGCSLENLKFSELIGTRHFAIFRRRHCEQRHVVDWPRLMVCGISRMSLSNNGRGGQFKNHLTFEVFGPQRFNPYFTCKEEWPVWEGKFDGFGSVNCVTHCKEPRALKRGDPRLIHCSINPQRKFVEISHRSRYWKGRPRNYRGLN